MTVTIWIIISIIIIVLITLVMMEREKVNKEKKKISFKESLDLIDTPIVTFQIGEKKCNFVLDTGSTASYIQKELIEEGKLAYKETSHTIDFFGVDGNSNSVKVVILCLQHRDNIFPNYFGMSDFSVAFDKIKDSENIRIHGIIGCDFFERYKCDIDFEECKIYPKKTSI